MFFQSALGQTIYNRRRISIEALIDITYQISV
jgi:hypothetical protein